MPKCLLLSMALFVAPLVGCASSDEPPPGYKVVGRFVDPSASAPAGAAIEGQEAQLVLPSAPAEGQDARLVLADGTVVIGTFRSGSWSSWRAGGGDGRITGTKLYTLKKKEGDGKTSADAAAPKECMFCINKEWPDGRKVTESVMVPCP
jgi:hypothetical protein